MHVSHSRYQVQFGSPSDDIVPGVTGTWSTPASRQGQQSRSNYYFLSSIPWWYLKGMITQSTPHSDRQAGCGEASFAWFVLSLKKQTTSFFVLSSAVISSLYPLLHITTFNRLFYLEFDQALNWLHINPCPYSHPIPNAMEFVLFSEYQDSSFSIQSVWSVYDRYLKCVISKCHLWLQA